MKGHFPNKRKKIILGITGSYGSGKTTVARILGSYGAEVIDADRIAHRVSGRRGKARTRIIDIFGRRILKKNGSVDRKKLANIVFADKVLLGRLNKVIHPEVIRLIKAQISQSAKKVNILDAPLLIEAGLQKMVDRLIVVNISKEEQIKRLQKKTGSSRQGILKIIRHQLPLSYKLRLADFIIDNNGSLEETRKQARQIRRLWWRN